MTRRNAMLSRAYQGHGLVFKSISILLASLLLMLVPIENIVNAKPLRAVSTNPSNRLDNDGLLQPELEFYYIYDIDDLAMTNPQEGQPLLSFQVEGEDVPLFHAAIACKIKEAGKPAANVGISLRVWNGNTDTTYTDTSNEEGFTFYYLAGSAASEGYSYKAYITDNPYVETDARKISFSATATPVSDDQATITPGPAKMLLDENDMPNAIEFNYTIQSTIDTSIGYNFSVDFDGNRITQQTGNIQLDTVVPQTLTFEFPLQDTTDFGTDFSKGYLVSLELGDNQSKSSNYYASLVPQWVVVVIVGS